MAHVGVANIAHDVICDSQDEGDIWPESQPLPNSNENEILQGEEATKQSIVFLQLLLDAYLGCLYYSRFAG